MPSEDTVLLSRWLTSKEEQEARGALVTATVTLLFSIPSLIGA